METFVKSLGFELENGYITKNGSLVEARDGDKIHIKNVAMIKKNDEGETVFVRNNFNEMVNEVKSVNENKKKSGY